MSSTAGSLPAGALEVALDDALGRGLVSGAQLRRRLDAIAECGRPGLSALRALLATRLEPPRWLQSQFERRLFALLRAAGVPLPVPEVLLPDELIATVLRARFFGTVPENRAKKPAAARATMAPR